MKHFVLNPTATDNNNNNGSPKTSLTLNTTKVSTMNTNMVRRWWSILLLLGIVFSFGLGMFSPNSAFALPSAPCIPVGCEPCDCSGFWRFLNGQCICYSQGTTKVYGHVSAGGATTTSGTGLGQLNAVNPNTSQEDEGELPDGSPVEQVKKGYTLADFNVNYEHVNAAEKTNVYVGNPKTPGNGTVYANVYMTWDTVNFTMLIITNAPDFKTYPTSANLWEEISAQTENEEEVLKTLEQFSDISKYVDNMVMVYPNPTNSVAFAKVSQDFINSYEVTNVNYELFNAEQKLINKFAVKANNDAHVHSEQCAYHQNHSNNVLDAITIPAEHIAQAGIYYLKCDITFIDNGNKRTQTVTVPFMVSK